MLAIPQAGLVGVGPCHGERFLLARLGPHVAAPRTRCPGLGGVLFIRTPGFWPEAAAMTVGCLVHIQPHSSGERPNRSYTTRGIALDAQCPGLQLVA